MKKFTEEEKQIMISLYQTTMYKDIAKILGNETTTCQVRSWLNNNGYKKSSKHKYTAEEQKFIKDNYLTMSYADIAQELHLDVENVRAWALQHLGAKRRRDFNRQYFKNITTPNQAYWLGFIFADGWITRNDRNYELGIELQASDIDHLQKFSTELNNAFPITRLHNEKLIPGNTKISITDSCIIRVYSKDIVEDLIQHNVVERKTLSDKFPKIENYFFDFLRGYFDGDGCVYVSRDNKIIQAHITSAQKPILKYIQNKLSEYNINSAIYQEKERKYRIYINGNYACEFFKLLYKDSTPQNRLKRKYEKYMTYIQSLPAEKSA